VEPPAKSDGGLFTAAKRVRSFEDIVTQIREAIIDGRLAPGKRLPGERELSAIFGVSRSTLRESLRMLEAIGVIEIRPGTHGGVVVTGPGEDQVGSALGALIRFRGATAAELAEFRTGFEGENAQLAAERADDEDLAELDAIAQRFAANAAVQETPWRTLAEVDLAFHEAVARASKNQVRVAIMLGISQAFYAASSALSPLASPKVRKTIVRELNQISAAIRDRDASLARSRMRRHVHKFAELERKVSEGQIG
jgi:GntR family transcriptional repressor for pyruvate dehydrogenase complex